MVKKDFCTHTKYNKIFKFVVRLSWLYINYGREGEDEVANNEFLKYTLLIQPDNPSSSSNETITLSEGNNDLLKPLIICPASGEEAYMSEQSEILMRKVKEQRKIEPIFGTTVSISPPFRTIRLGDQHLLDSDNCKFHVVPLFEYSNQESADGLCGACRISAHGTICYFCSTCRRKFHKECMESPFEIKHPSYPFLSFQLSYFMAVSLKCICCKADINNIGYYCPTFKLSMHPLCAFEPIPLVIDHPKRHPHPLTFFPKQAFLPCNVCGLVKESVPMYACVECVFVVHKDCIYSPYVIKISRHHHRISFTYSLPSGELSCGVCRREVDNHYGAYSCNKSHDDEYFVHTRCALRGDLWDGVELEGEPEEPDEKDVESFKTIADGIIRHFSHDHLLKLEVNRVYYEDKICQACILPVNFEDEFYLCMNQCDFILHKACASAPRTKPHPLHAHTLTLKVVTNQYNGEGYAVCNACKRYSCGFVYESDRGSWTFRLDIRCASVYEPFEYQGHEHPLFVALMPEEENEAICQICQQYFEIRKLNCIECDYVICFECATVPYKARYKHDKHLLTFRKEKEESDESGWCEVCEKKLVYSRKGGFYACDDYCGTTLHVDCLLGKNPYVRAGQTIRSFHGKDIQILSNNTMSRPFCHCNYCDEDRCIYGVVFKKENKTFCNFYHAQSK